MPRSILLTVAVLVAVLGYGGVVQLVQLAIGGWPPYRWAPTWLASYFTSLTLLDPLAALLLWARRAIGLYLAILSLATDAAANGYAVYSLPGATATTRIGQVRVSVLALAALIMAPRVRRWMHPVPHMKA